MEIKLDGWSVDYDKDRVTVHAPRLNGVDMSKTDLVRDGEDISDAVARAVAHRVRAFVKAMSYRWYAGPKQAG